MVLYPKLFCLRPGFAETQRCDLIAAPLCEALRVEEPRGARRIKGGRCGGFSCGSTDIPVDFPVIGKHMEGSQVAKKVNHHKSSKSTYILQHMPTTNPLHPTTKHKTMKGTLSDSQSNKMHVTKPWNEHEPIRLLAKDGGKKSHVLPEGARVLLGSKSGVQNAVSRSWSSYKSYEVHDVWSPPSRSTGGILHA